MTKEQGNLPLIEEIIVTPLNEEEIEKAAETAWIIEDEGVIDPELPMPEDVTTLNQFAKHLKAKKKSRYPAPKHCEITCRPDNIDKYITDMLQSIRVVISNHAFIPFNHSDIDVIVNSLVVYLYDKDSDGLARWQRYDENLVPRPPYHKWVLTYAYYAAKGYLAKMGRYAKEMGIQTSERPDGDFATDPGYIHHSQLNKLRPDLEPERSDVGLTNSELGRYVDHARAHLQELERVYSKINPLSWQVYALPILDRVMAGETLAEIRTTIGSTGISRTSMNKWWDSIRKEVIEHLDENPFTGE